MTKKRPRFALRTIQNGCVKIFGITYRPHLDASRFDGMRAAFGLYWIGDKRDEKCVSLWGSEAQYRAKNEEESARLWPGPFCDGRVFKWDWRHPTNEER